uniref:Uncharacterized protein n=1 Tax=Arundo donax TaxID=35708 RepID=A0A0A9HMN2_ARUDO
MEAPAGCACARRRCAGGPRRGGTSSGGVRCAAW